MAEEKFQVVALKGCLVPFSKGKALTLEVPGSRKPHLPVFSSEETLQVLEGAYDKVIPIEDVESFLTLLDPKATVAYDPHLKNGCLRWMEIQRTGIEET
jgi:hypothetical protein